MSRVAVLPSSATGALTIPTDSIDNAIAMKLANLTGKHAHPNWLPDCSGKKTLKRLREGLSGDTRSKPVLIRSFFAILISNACARNVELTGAIE